MTPPPASGFPWRRTGVVALVVIVVIVGAGLLLARTPGTPPAPAIVVDSPTAAPLPSEVGSADATGDTAADPDAPSTVLLQVRGRDRTVQSSILLAFGGNSPIVSATVIPTTLLLPTQPVIALSDVDGPSGPVGAREPLGTLLGVRIDETIELDRLAWAGLIDALGNPSLRGMEARDVPGALEPVLAALPVDRERVGQLLTSLGSMARTTLPNESTSRLLTALGDRVRRQGLQVSVLPVTVVKAGGSPVSMVDPVAARDLIARDLPGAMLQPGHPGPVRVVVERGAATLGAFLAVQRRLATAGYAVLAGSAPADDAARSRVVAAGDSVAVRARANALATALGLPVTAVSVDPSPMAEVDLRVVLGPGVPAA